MEKLTQIMNLHKEGYTGRHIAEELGMTPRMVDYRIGILRAKGLLETPEVGKNRVATIGRKPGSGRPKKAIRRRRAKRSVKGVKLLFVPRAEEWQVNEKYPSWKPQDNVYAFRMGNYELTRESLRRNHARA